MNTNKLVAARHAKSLRKFAGARGATAVEYALMLVMILLIVAAVFKTLGDKVASKVSASETALGTGG
jgi:Flp pilus assembly pilin Flp